MPDDAHTKTLPPSDYSTSDKAIPKQLADIALLDMTEFRLPLPDWEVFCERLDAPPRTIAALEQLFSETKPFQK